MAQPSDSKFKVGDDRSVKTWNDDSFHKLREVCGVKDDFLLNQFAEKDFKSGSYRVIDYDSMEFT